MEVEMSKKKCTLLRCEVHFQVNMLKAPHVRTTFGRSDAQRVHAVVARSTFGSKHAEDTTRSVLFWTLKRRFVWPARGIAHLPKSEQNVGVLLLSSSFKSVGRRGAFQEDLRRCISRGRRSTRDMMLGGQGADFIWVH